MVWKYFNHFFPILKNKILAVDVNGYYFFEGVMSGTDFLTVSAINDAIRTLKKSPTINPNDIVKAVNKGILEI